MARKLPGSSLHRFLARWVHSDTLHDVVEPAIADLQHEAQDSAGRWRRSLILVRGYAALLRALFLAGVRPTGVIARAGALIALSIAGAALMTWARSATDDAKIFNSAFVLPMLVAPVVLRTLGAATSFWKLFAGTVAVGLITRGFAGFLETDQAAPLVVRALQLSIRSLPVVVVSAAAATAAWRPALGREPFVRQLVLAIFGGGLAAALAFGPIVAWPHGATPAAIAATVPFYLCLFAVVLTVTLVPLMLVIRSWIRTRVQLATAGAVLSPAAICSSSYLDGGNVRQCLELLRTAPGAFTIHGLPWIVGAVVLGWWLAKRPIALNS